MNAVPSKDTLTASIGKMRSAATAWHTASQHLNNAQENIEDLKMTRIQMGIFQIPYAAYMDTTSFIQRVSKEGATQTAQVGDTLKACADKYEEEENHNAHQIAGQY